MVILNAVKDADKLIIDLGKAIFMPQ